MITRSEASLTTGEYSDFQAASGDAAALIKLQRLGPVWSDPGHTPASAGTGLKARVFDGEIVRVFNSGSGILAAEKLADESGGNQDWLSVGVHSNVVVNGDIEFDLVTDDATLRLFYYNSSDRMAYSDCSDLGVGFGEPTVIDDAVGDLRHLTATTLTTVHYITLTAQKNRRFHVGNYSDAWYFANSDILYPFPIDSMSAIQLSDGTDVIALAATLPPLIGSRVIGVEITQDVKTVQSILVFLYNNGRWSDHYIVDTIDNIPVTPARSDVRLNYYNDTVFLSYNRRGGSDAVNYTKCALSRSSTGKFFELPELIDLDTPVVIVPRDDYLYVIGKNTLRSPACIFGAQTPVEQGVTDFITKTAASAGEIRQTTYEMASGAQSDGSYELDTTLADLSATERMQMICDLGYWVNGEQLLVRVGIEDIVTVDEMSRMPAHGISMASMDRLGRLNRIVSDHASEFPGMEIGRDPLTDPTGTGWGGMRHLASYKPSWKAEEGTLKLVSNNKEGLAVSTFVTDALNGSLMTGIELAYDNQNEYAGIAFHVFDKNTLFYAAYHPDEDQVQLYKREGSGEDDGYNDTLIDYVDTSGWSWSVATGTYYHLRIWAYYGRLYMYRSNDGITWTAVSWNGSSETYTELPGHSGGTYRAWSGKFGLVGYGYSNEDTSPYTPAPWYPPTEPPSGDPPDIAILWNENQIFRSVNFSETTPDWTVETLGIEASPGDDVVAPANGIRDMVLADTGFAYVASESGVWKCDMRTSGNTWSQLFTPEDMKGALAFFDNNPSMVGIVQGSDGLIYVSEYHGGDTMSSGYAVITSEDVITYSYFPPYRDYVVQQIPNGCDTGIDLYRWKMDIHEGELGPYEITRTLFEYFTVVGETAQRVMHVNGAGHVVTAGTYYMVDEARGSCSSGSIKQACGSALTLFGPLRETPPGTNVDLLHTNSVNRGPCPSVGTVTSVDGDAPYYMLLQGGRFPYGGDQPWSATVGSWIHRSGPNGYGGYAWAAALIDSRRRLIRPDGEVLLIPEDYYLDHNDMGYTEGYAGNGLMMFNIVRQTRQEYENMPYALWTEDGSETWVEKTQKIKLAVASGGLEKNWTPGNWYGIEFSSATEDYS